MNKMTIATAAGCVLAAVSGAVMAQGAGQQAMPMPQLGGSGPYINFFQPVSPQMTPLGPIQTSVTPYTRTTGNPAATGFSPSGPPEFGNGYGYTSGDNDEQSPENTGSENQAESGGNSVQAGFANPQEAQPQSWQPQNNPPPQGWTPQQQQAWGQQPPQQGWGQQQQQQQQGWGQQSAQQRSPQQQQSMGGLLQGRELALVGTIVNANAQLPGDNDQIVEVITHSGHHVFVDVGQQGQLQNRVNLSNNQVLYFLGTIENVNGRPVLLAKQVAEFGQLNAVQRNNPQQSGDESNQ